jgi:hypothetical protein
MDQTIYFVRAVVQLTPSEHLRCDCFLLSPMLRSSMCIPYIHMYTPSSIIDHFFNETIEQTNTFSFSFVFSFIICHTYVHVCIGSAFAIAFGLTSLLCYASCDHWKITCLFFFFFFCALIYALLLYVATNMPGQFDPAKLQKFLASKVRHTSTQFIIERTEQRPTTRACMT